MKKLLYTLAFLPVLLLGSCAKEEIVFEHEKPAFELRDGKILLEVIVPSSTKTDDEIYIAGEFNGGDEAAAADPQWRLEHSDVINLKWGIYLDPATFVAGKTLADGYHFVSVNEREEVSALGEQVVRTLNPAPGTRTNIYVTKWASFYDVAGNESLPEHDGVRIYIVDETGWDEIALYQWGDQNNLGGDWPGLAPTGTLKFKGVNYKYFEYSDEVIGLSQNLIFNNNDGGTQLADYALTFEAGVADYFLKVTAEGVEALDAPAQGESLPDHDGVRVYTLNETTWDELALYQWGDENNFGGNWPGKLPDGTITFKGVEYVYFEYTDDIYGLTQNLIFNNNGAGTQLPDINNVAFTEGVKDYFTHITDEIAELIDNPAGGEPLPPTPPTPAGKAYKVYVEDNTGWDDLYLYSWGGAEAFGAWPGTKGEETEVVGGVTYKVFTTIKVQDECAYNFIFNNNNGTQYDAVAGVFEGTIYLRANADNAEYVTPGSTYNIYVKDNTSWEGLYLYSWGSSELFGGWPGATVNETVMMGGEAWKKITFNTIPGDEYHLIFNNNSGNQLEGFECEIGTWGDVRNFFIEITADNAVAASTPKLHINVTNNTTWGAIAVYAWGDDPIFGDWPGVQITGTYVEVAAEHWGKNENLIFNNNGGGTQVADLNVTLTQDYNVKVTDEGASLL